MSARLPEKEPAAYLLAQTIDLLTVPATPYGHLLLAKLALFAIMLMLAALNRYVLTPALIRRTAIEPGSLRHLRLSVRLELGLIAIILALVAYLGTLDPAGLA